ncbi:MAG TPA: VCBS repeat-containing protein [Rudaea sp.]
MRRFRAFIRAAGASLLLASFQNLIAAPAVPTPVALLPPQVLAVDASTWAVEAGDIDGDGFDDIVTLSLYSDRLAPGTAKPGAQVTVNVYQNAGKSKRPDEAVSFSASASIALNPTAKIARPGQRMGSLQICDIDNDGKADLLVTVPGAGAIVVLWNQGDNGGARFQFVADNVQPNKALTIYPSLATANNAAPLFAAALDLDGDGANDIVAYHAGLTPPVKKDPTGLPDIVLSTGYESFGVMLGVLGSPRTFDTTFQQRTWPGCDLQLGGGNCGILPDCMANEHIFDHRLDAKSGVCAGGGNDCFFFAASDVAAMDSAPYDKATHSYSYTPATITSDASTRIRVVPHGLPTRDGQNAVDSFWFEGEGATNQFHLDTTEKLIRRHDSISAPIGHQRSGGSDLGRLSDGHWVLFTGGGFTRCTGTWNYTPNAANCHSDMPPAYLDRPAQLGSFVRWLQAGDGVRGGPLLLTLADYYQFWEPGSQAYWWAHEKMDGSHANVFAPSSLLMWEFLEEERDAAGTLEFKPYLQLDTDSRRFAALSIQGAIGYAVKPQVTSGRLGSKTESSLVVLNYDAFAAVAPTTIGKANLQIYRPDDGTYPAITPHLDGVIIGKYLKDGYPASISNTLPAGEKSGVIVGTSLGAPDPARYAVVKEKTTGAVKGLFAVGQAETVAGITKDGIVVPGLSTLAIGHYTLEIHNAKAMASIDFNISNPFGIVSTDYDWLAGKTCGLRPDTRTGDLWPGTMHVTVSDFPGADKLQAIRWIKSDGTIKEVPAAGNARFDAASSTIALTVPAVLGDGRWTFYIKAADQWQRSGFEWNVTHDLATLETCSKQVALVNEEAYAQCDNTNLYLDAVDYSEWPNRVGPGALRFFGEGFAQAHIRSAAIKQGTQRIFSAAVNVVGDNEIHVFFNDDALKERLVPGLGTDLYFYSENADVVQANGVPASLSKPNWRLPQSGSCVPAPPQITEAPTGGTGTGGAFQTGDTIKVRGKNLIYPKPTAIKFVLKGSDGSLYALDSPRLPDDWYTHHYDNDDATLYFTVPEDLTPYSLTTTHPIAGLPSAALIAKNNPRNSPAAGALVPFVQQALATSALSSEALAVITKLPPVAQMAIVGVTATGLSIYQGVENSIWLYKKIDVLTKHGGTGVDKPGKPGDDQPKPPQYIYTVSFVTQPPQLTELGPLDYVVVRAGSEYEADIKAEQIAIPAFVLANYFVSGRVHVPWTWPAPLPSTDYVALMGSVELVGPDGTNPIGIRKTYGRSMLPLIVNCGPIPTVSTFLLAEVDLNLLPGQQQQTIQWRRNVVLKNYPPSLCSPYNESLGDPYSTARMTYVTGEQNNYTSF